MATENLGKCITVPAGADLSASQYCFVKLNSSGQAVLPSTGGDAIGILQNNPNAAGQAAVIMVGNGVSKLKAAAATTLGDYVSTDNAGKGLDNATGDYRLGQYLEAATGANQIVSVLFEKKGVTT